MTIYKTQTGEKKSDKEPEVLTEPLTGLKDESECEEAGVGAPKLVRVTYFPRRRRTWVNLCLITTALLVLGTGCIAAIFLYKHLSNKLVVGHCGVTYYDELYHQPDSLYADAPSPQDTPAALAHMGFFQEGVEVSEVDMYEMLTIPKFDEVEETEVCHDFHQNLTAIVDPYHRKCFIMALNRSQIAPPRDLIDLIVKLKTRYYMPKASVVREQYRIVQPALSDLTVLGSIIMRECYWYDTYRLQKYSPRELESPQQDYLGKAFKRSVDPASEPMEVFTHLGYYSPNKEDSKNYVIKLEVFRPVEVPEVASSQVAQVAAVAQDAPVADKAQNAVDLAQ